MADLGKNGYSYTGYTEPFIVPTGATIASAAALTAIVPVQFTDVVGGVPIENTEYRNAGLFVRSDITDTTVTSFTTKDINFDTRMDSTHGGRGIWILDIDGTFCEVTSVTYAVSTGLYTITVTNTPDVDEGQPYRVVGRIPDTNAKTATQNYVAGQKVIEVY